MAMDERVMIEAIGSGGAVILVSVVFYSVLAIISRAKSVGSKPQKEFTTDPKRNKVLSQPEKVDFEKERKLGLKQSSLNRPAVSHAYQNKFDDNVVCSFRDVEQVNLDDFPKAARVLEYSEPAMHTWIKVKSWPRNLQLDFLVSIEADPAQDVLSLFERFAADIESALRPYSCEEANNALKVAREIGPSAEKEFIEVYELLGRPKNVDGILKKVERKFCSLSQADVRAIQMELLYGTTKEAAERLKRFGYEAKSIDGNSNLGGVFYGPDGSAQSYLNTVGLIELMLGALAELDAAGLVK